MRGETVPVPSLGWRAYSGRSYYSVDSYSLIVRAKQSIDQRASLPVMSRTDESVHTSNRPGSFEDDSAALETRARQHQRRFRETVPLFQIIVNIFTKICAARISRRRGL